MLYFDIESLCLVSQNNLMKFNKKTREYESNVDILVFHFIGAEREHEIRQGTTQDGTLHCHYTVSEKSHQIVRPFATCPSQAWHSSEEGSTCLSGKKK